MSSTANGDFDTKYGVVHARFPGPHKDPPYKNVHRYDRPEGDVVLQGPALRAFKAAEVRATPRRLRRKGKVQPILISGVGYRAYDYQAYLYSLNGKDGNPPGRYADPDTSNHVEALAIDLDMGVSLLRRLRVTRALKAEGFLFTVDGEPWHGSFRVAG